MLQRTQEWFNARCGKITASRIADVISKVKTGESATRANYKAQLVAERLTGIVQDSYTNAAMQYGIDNEPFARMAYEMATGNQVIEIGSVDHPTIKNASASPDGLITDNLGFGLIEIKCPLTKTHINYILADVIPPEYVPQMAWQCACARRQFVDFVSYDSRMPDDLQLFIKRYIPTPAFLQELETEVVNFDREIEDLISRLNEKRKTR